MVLEYGFLHGYHFYVASMANVNKNTSDAIPMLIIAKAYLHLHHLVGCYTPMLALSPGHKKEKKEEKPW